MKITKIEIVDEFFAVSSEKGGYISVTQRLFSSTSTNAIGHDSNCLTHLEALVDAIKVATDVSQGESIEVKL